MKEPIAETNTSLPNEGHTAVASEAQAAAGLMKPNLVSALIQRGALRLVTPGGRFQVRWDENGSATALGQLTFFAEFLEVTGLFARWMEGCPMSYTSPNAPAKVDVLGTWLLSILDGQRRYAHVAGLRGDEVAPQILGMNKIGTRSSATKACVVPWPISRRISPNGVAKKRVPHVRRN